MNYFNPNTPYTFRGKGGNFTNVITVVFDANGNATVTKTQETILPTDQEAIYLFATTSDYSFDTSTNMVEILGDLDKFWYLYFDNNNPPFDNATVAKDEPKKELEVSCSCKSAGACSVSWFLQGSMLCVSCIVGADCMNCNEPVWSREMHINSMSVLIKAESISM